MNTFTLAPQVSKLDENGKMIKAQLLLRGSVCPLLSFDSLQLTLNYTHMINKLKKVKIYIISLMVKINFQMEIKLSVYIIFIKSCNLLTF